MPVVKMPDGTQVQFPDTMPPDQIKSMILTKFPDAGKTAAQRPTGYDATPVAQGLSGINEGIANTLGAPVDLTNLALRGGAAALHAVGGPDIQLPVDAFGGSQTIKNAMGGAIKAPGTDATGQFVRRVGQEVGGSLIPGMGIVSKAAAPVRAAVRQGVMALSSGAGAAALDQVSGNNPYADMAGQILGGGVLAGGLRAAQKVVTPFPMNDPARAAANATMADAGVGLSAGQQLGSKGLQYRESALGGGAAASLNSKQQEQFTSAALSKIGVTADRATPAVMDQAYNDIGGQFGTLAGRNTLVPSRQMGTDLRQVLDNYAGANATVSASNQVPVVKNMILDIVDDAKSGSISGAKYQDYATRLAEIGRGAGSDNALRTAVYGIRNALDDAMEQSISQNNPQDLGKWQQARANYRNLLVIENAVGKAGPAAADGIITPANLAAAAKTVQGKRAFVRGQGDFNDLAHAGVKTMTPLPDSGTAPRIGVKETVAGLGAAGGLLAAGQPLWAAATAGALAAPRIAGGLMMSGIGQKYLANQAWTGGLGPSLAKAAVGPAVGTMTRNLAQDSADPNDPNNIRLRALN